MAKNESVAPDKSSALKEGPPGAGSPSYPDWAAMQAYYGAGVPMPPPYFSTAVPGHAPHPYVWGPQPLVPPFGHPYAAMYGGVFPHPPMSFIASPLCMEKPKKDRGPKKKHMGHDGPAAPTGNANGRSAAACGIGVLSESEEYDSEDSTDGSDEYYAAGGAEVRKKSISLLPGKARPPCGVVSLPNNAVVPGCTIESRELPTQNERDRKRQRRKQSNRESARRSRLRKQAETEELASKVESLSAENLALKIELSHLKENSEQLRTRNSALMKRLESKAEPSAG